MRAVQALNPDIVFVAAYPPDSVGIVRAANEVGLTPKMFGGTFIGLLVTPIKAQLGPLMNGIVNNEVFLPAPSLTFPGTKELLAKYQAAAATARHRSGRLGVPAARLCGRPGPGASGRRHQEPRSMPSSPTYMRSHTFKTVVGDIAFGKDGEWAKSRVFFTQFQHVTGNSHGSVQGHHPRSHRVAEGIQDRRHDLSLRGSKEAMNGTPSSSALSPNRRRRVRRHRSR